MTPSRWALLGLVAILIGVTLALVASGWLQFTWGSPDKHERTVINLEV